VRKGQHGRQLRPPAHERARPTLGHARHRDLHPPHRSAHAVLPRRRLALTRAKGRTGRFGRKGISINFVHDKKTWQQMEQIEKQLGKPIVRIETNDLDEMEEVRAVSGVLAVGGALTLFAENEEASKVDSLRLILHCIVEALGDCTMDGSMMWVLAEPGQKTRPRDGRVFALHVFSSMSSAPGDHLGVGSFHETLRSTTTQPSTASSYSTLTAHRPSSIHMCFR
jgi:hypothetical protein